MSDTHYTSHDVSDNPPTLFKPPARGYLKCERCRKDGRRCLEDDNPSTKSSGKCRRCALLGHACGPRKRAVSRRISTIRVDKTASQENVLDTSFSSADQGSQTVHSHHADRFDNPVLDWLVGVHIIQSILLRCRSDNIALLRRLPDDIAFRERERQLRDLNSALNQRQRDNMLCSDVHVETGSDVLLRENLRLWSAVLQFQHLRMNQPDTISSQNQIPATLFRRGRGFVSSLSRPDCVLCTQNILAGIEPNTLQHIPGSIRAPEVSRSSYINAQNQIQDLLEELFCEHSPQRRAGSTSADSLPQIHFPAAHLAFWNGDYGVALELALEGGVLSLPTNMCNQNLLQIAVQAGDLGFLKKLADFDRNALTDASLAGSGYTPLDIATIFDQFDIFSLLIGRRTGLADLTKDLLLLATLSNSPTIVDIILERQTLVLPPYTRVTWEAIQHGLEDIALKFVPWLTAPYISSETREELHVQARARNMFRLAQHLDASMKREDSRQRAINSLHRHLTENFT